MSSNSIQEADLYRKFIENVSCPIQINQMIYNGKGEPVDYRILDINHAGELQIAIKKENIIGRKVSDILPDTEPEWFVRYDEAVKTGKVLSFDMYGGPFDRTFNTLVIPLGDLRFAIMFRDITERRQEEKEKQILLEDLQKEKDRLTFLFNHIPEEIWFTDERGNIILTNKAVREKFRTVYPSINTAEIAGSLEIFRPDGSIRPLDEAPLLRAVKGEQIINGEEIIKIPDSNELRCRQFSAAPIYDSAGNISGAAAVVRDITAQKKIERDLRESEEKANALVSELEEGERQKNRFISILAHELRNPLAVIKMSLDLQKLSKPDEDIIKKTFENIEKQTQYFTHLINDLLEITRITQNKIELKKEQTDLNKLIRDALKDYQMLFDQKEIKTETVLCSEPVMLEGDPLRLNQIIGNLLHNAVKFTPDSGKISIKLDKDDNNRQAVISVSDNGEGINPELMPKMFQPFMQGDNNSDRNREGLGLGLTIVKGMAELHGGNVEAFSEGPGKGMTFTVRLPITKGNIKEQKYCLNAENISDKSLKILIVEDNKSLAEMTCEYLKLFGHEAAAVHCGSECIKKADKMRPDVILCDIGLPDMSGYEVAMKIRKSAELKDTVLIAVSGYARSEDIKRSREAGFDRHLAKPVYMDMLRMTLDKICE